MRLVDFPFVEVLFACPRCPRCGQCRLARLAERYGADIPLTDLREAIFAYCEMSQTKTLDVYRVCGCFYEDLVDGPSPDLPR